MNEFVSVSDYLKELKKRNKKSRVYKKYQLNGLIIADLLKDWSHKSLYIKLAKEIDDQKLLEIAKLVNENKKIKNPGAYFMAILKKENLIKKETKPKTKKIKVQTLFKNIKKKKSNHFPKNQYSCLQFKNFKYKKNFVCIQVQSFPNILEPNFIFTTIYRN
ncbi:MAG: hypothetical protein ACP5QN_03120 [Minisyncoccia bacterium]